MFRLVLGTLALCFSVSAQAVVLDGKTDGALYSGTWDAAQDQKAVGALYSGTWDAAQDQKAVGARYDANQDKTTGAKQPGSETPKVLDLNEGF